MPAQTRFKTKFPGVFYIEGQSITKDQKEKIFIIRYYRKGAYYEEKAGRQSQEMTAAKAARIRALKIEGKLPSNKEVRATRAEEKKARQAKPWTLNNVWVEYASQRPNTKSLKTDFSRFNKHIKPSFGEKCFDEITPIDVDRLRISLLKTKSAQTVKHVIDLIKRLSKFGTDKRLCKGLDFKPTAPKVDNLKTEFMTDEELKRLLKTIEGDVNPYAGALMKMALYSGMRRGELFKLRWTDVDFERGFIRIVSPKGGKEASIPLNQKARETLEALPKTDSPFVFPGRYTGGLTDIHKALKAITTKAGLPADFRPMHGLRHHFASSLASSGEVDLFVIQRLLNHRTPIMTQRYSHLRDSALKKASELAGQLVTEAVKSGENKNEAGEKVVELRK